MAGSDSNESSFRSTKEAVTINESVLSKNVMIQPRESLSFSAQFKKRLGQCYRVHAGEWIEEWVCFQLHDLLLQARKGT